jgi:RhoGAP domain/Variant SH3 domain
MRKRKSNVIVGTVIRNHEKRSDAELSVSVGDEVAVLGSDERRGVLVQLAKKRGYVPLDAVELRKKATTSKKRSGKKKEKELKSKAKKSQKALEKQAQKRAKAERKLAKKRQKSEQQQGVAPNLKRLSHAVRQKIAGGTGGTGGGLPASSKKGKKRRRVYVFGAPVEACVWSDAATGRAVLPKFLEAAADRIRLHLDEEGLFRVSGELPAIVQVSLFLEKSERDRLRAHVRKRGRRAPPPPPDPMAPSPVDFAQSPIHTVTGVFKLLFRKLPEPLLTYALFDDFLAAPSKADGVERAIELVRVRLPLPNRELFLFLLALLDKIASVPANLMSEQALAIVFAPSLLGTADPSPSMAASVALRSIPAISFLIENAPKILAPHQSGTATSAAAAAAASNDLAHDDDQEDHQDYSYGSDLSESDYDDSDYDSEYDEEDDFDGDQEEEEGEEEPGSSGEAPDLALIDDDDDNDKDADSTSSSSTTVDDEGVAAAQPSSAAKQSSLILEIRAAQQRREEKKRRHLEQLKQREIENLRHLIAEEEQLFDNASHLSPASSPAPRSVPASLIQVAFPPSSDVNNTQKGTGEEEEEERERRQREQEDEEARIRIEEEKRRVGEARRRREEEEKQRIAQRQRQQELDSDHDDGNDGVQEQEQEQLIHQTPASAMQAQTQTVTIKTSLLSAPDSSIATDAPGDSTIHPQKPPDDEACSCASACIIS